MWELIFRYVMFLRDDATVLHTKIHCTGTHGTGT